MFASCSLHDNTVLVGSCSVGQIVRAACRRRGVVCCVVELSETDGRISGLGRAQWGVVLFRSPPETIVVNMVKQDVFKEGRGSGRGRGIM